MLLRKLVVELIGTFFFVLTIGLTVVGTSGPNAAIAPLAIGASLMVMVYAGGHISGGHYNPAVTLAVWVRGRFPIGEVLPYWAAQVAGAVLAGLLTTYLKGYPAPAEHPPELIPSIFVEVLYMFALAYVVLNVATARGTAGNSYYGLAIGFTVVIGAFAAGSISGGAFNPAIASGLGVMRLVSGNQVVVLVLSNLVGGVLAGLVFRFLNPDDLGPVTAPTDQSPQPTASAVARGNNRRSRR